MQDSHMQANTYAIFSVGKGSNQNCIFKRSYSAERFLRFIKTKNLHYNEFTGG